MSALYRGSLLYKSTSVCRPYVRSLLRVRVWRNQILCIFIHTVWIMYHIIYTHVYFRVYCVHFGFMLCLDALCDVCMPVCATVATGESRGLENARE